jgi:hypothetical protein
MLRAMESSFDELLDAAHARTSRETHARRQDVGAESAARA